jgi:hypothetical protein
MKIKNVGAEPLVPHFFNLVKPTIFPSLMLGYSVNDDKAKQNAPKTPKALFGITSLLSVAR